jgi:hypothetical protein
MSTKRSAANILHDMANGSIEPETDMFPPDAGYLYALVNPVWPGVVKIGFAGSVKRRFFSYLTGDPYRAYRLLGWSDAMLDARRAEKQAHDALAASRMDGSREWFRVSESAALAQINRFRAKPLSAPVGVCPTDGYTVSDEDWDD